jgi:hypothetical protein
MTRMQERCLSLVRARSDRGGLAPGHRVLLCQQV